MEAGKELLAVKEDNNYMKYYVKQDSKSFSIYNTLLDIPVELKLLGKTIHGQINKVHSLTIDFEGDFITEKVQKKLSNPELLDPMIVERSNKRLVNKNRPDMEVEDVVSKPDIRESVDPALQAQNDLIELSYEER